MPGSRETPPNPPPKITFDNLLSPAATNQKIKRRFSFPKSSKPSTSSSNDSANDDNSSETVSAGKDEAPSSSSSSVTKKKPSFLATAMQNMKKSTSSSDGKASGQMGTVLEEPRRKSISDVGPGGKTKSPEGKPIQQPGSQHTSYSTTQSPVPTVTKSSVSNASKETNDLQVVIKPSPTPSSLKYPLPPVPTTQSSSIASHVFSSSTSDFAASLQSSKDAVKRLKQVNQVLTLLASGFKLGAGWLPLVGDGVSAVTAMMNSAVAVEVGKVAALRLVEHSATVLAEVQQSIIDHNGDFSPTMESNLNRLILNLHTSMLLLIKLADRSFLKLYLFTNDISAQVAAAEHELQQCAMLFQLQALISIDAWQQQATRDRAADMEILFQMMRQAMADSEAMIRLINVKSDEQAEAIKTLQRSMETMIALQEMHYAEEHGQYSPVGSRFPTIEYDHALHPVPPVKYGSARGWLGYVEDAQSPVASTATSLGLDLSGVPANDLATTKSISVPPSLPMMVREDSLDSDFADHKDFCEMALDVLRRHSSDVDVPDWTITSLEVTHDKIISSGFFAEIWKGTWKGQVVALKQLNANTDRKIFLKEINTWRSLRSPHILPLLGASSATSRPPWFLVSPYMMHGNALQYLASSEGKRANKVALVHQMSQGMKYLHSRELIHGDFKAVNTLITDEGRAIICDFGLSQLKAEIVARSGVANAQTDIWSINGGTMRWKSPERLNGSPLSYSADVYAFAITIFEIHTLAIPFGPVDDAIVKKNIIAGARPERAKDITDALWVLQESCWSQDPVARPSFEVIEKQIAAMYINKSTERQGSVLTATTSSSENESFHTAFEDKIPAEQQAISPTFNHNVPLVDVPETSSMSSGSIHSIPPHLQQEPTNESDVVERIFRHHLEHKFDDRLRLPLWFPAPVALGSVGYIRHGQFVKLLDAHQPPIGATARDLPTGKGKGDLLPPRPFMNEFESLQVQTETVEVRGAAQNALDKAAVAWTKFIKGSGQTTEHAIAYRKTFAFKPGSTRSAFLVLEEGHLEIYKDNHGAREYLSDNMGWILEKFGDEHQIRKEDVIVIVGTLSAHNYAMLVSNFAPRVTVNFNAHADRHANEPWGTWSVDQKPSPDQLKTYKIQGESGEDELPRWCCKVSKISAGPSDAVLLARLRWSSVKQGYDMWD